ncbi:MAG: hypothetical protein AAF713_07615 [Pseudomonadota bacterium]
MQLRKTAPDPTITLRRADGTVWALRAVGRKFSPPHDVAHVVVERGLGLRRGFIGTIAAGGLFPQMQHLGGRLQSHGVAKSKALLKVNAKTLSEAEVVTAAFQQAMLAADPEYLASIRARTQHCPHRPGNGAIEAIWQDLSALRDRWDAMALEESLTLDWPEPADWRRLRGSTICP